MESTFQIRRILFPTDFSVTSEAAARYSSGLARATGAEVRLLHVVPLMSAWRGASESHYNYLSPEAARSMLASQEAAEKSTSRSLNEFRDKFFDPASQVAVRSGGVADTIVEYADEMDADLIMMTTRGLGPVRRFLIGSATAKVLHDTPRPLWTTPHMAEVGDYHPYRQIVCATDYRVLSRDLLRRAAGVADLFKGRLTVVSAIPCPAAAESACSGRESVQAIKRETAATIKKNLADLNITATVDVFEGSVGEVVQLEAVFAKADLIVIGHGRLGEKMGHLRTHAYEIIWNAPCPVLAI